MNATAPTYAAADRTALVAATAALCAGAAAFLGLPVIVGLLADMRGLSPDQLGQVASAETFGVAITALLGPWLLRRVAARTLMGAGLLALMVLHGLSALPLSFAGFVGVRLAASVATGVAMPAAVAVLGRAADPERAFAWAVSAQILLSALELLAFGPLAKAFGLWGVYGALAVLALAAVLLALRCAPPADIGAASAGGVRLPGAAWALIASVLLFFCAIGAYWTFIERAGVQAGLSADAMGGWLAASNAAALLGSMSAPWLARRVGERRVLLVGLLLAVLVPLGLLRADGGPIGVLVNLGLFVVLWNLLMVVQMAVLGRWDPQGRAVSLTPAAQGFGLALAPLLAGLLAEQHGFAVAVASASAFAALAVLATWLAFTRGAVPDTAIVST